MPLLPLLLLFLTSLIAGPAVAQDTRGIGLDNAPNETTAPSGKSYALVIGINEYDDEKLTDLTGARRDAEAVSQVLTEQGFEVIQLLDGKAHRQAIDDTLKLKLYPILNPEDRLLVYFAGHGISRAAAFGDEGYLVPADGDSGNPFNMLSMTDMVRIFNVLPAQQVLYLADACHSGLAQETRLGGADLVRVIMTAGTGDQQVQDNYQGHGLYTYFFLEGIRGAADMEPKDGLVTSTELHAYIKSQVEPIAQGRQTPTSSQMGAGDFVFRAGDGPVTATDASAVATRGAGLEVAYFDSYVLNRGVLHGVIPLTETETLGRDIVYKFETKSGRVQTVTRLNGAGLSSPNDDGVSQWSHVYTDGGTGDISEVVEINRLGEKVRRLHYSEEGATRVEFFDRYGKPSKTWLAVGRWDTDSKEEGKDVFGKGYAYDEHGLLEKEWYLAHSLNQARRIGEDGAWGWRYERNEAGQAIGKFPIDVDGEDTVTATGLARIEIRHDEKGNKIERNFFGTDGQLVLHNDDEIARWTKKYDARGNEIQTALFGTDGKPVLDPDGVAGWTTENDEYGNGVKRTYFGTTGQPVLNVHGFAGWTSRYDEKGNLIEQAYFGTEGEPILNIYKVARLSFKYDDMRSQIETASYGLDGELVADSSGIAREERTYDRRGNLIQVAYFGVDEQPVLDKNGIAGWTREFDERGNKVEVAYLGTQGEPILLQKHGYFRWNAKYDARGSLLEKAYFGINGEPVPRAEGYHRIVFTYDATGQQLTETWYDTEGNIIPQTPAE